MKKKRIIIISLLVLAALILGIGLWMVWQLGCCGFGKPIPEKPVSGPANYTLPEDCHCLNYTLSNCPEDCVERCISSCPNCDDCIDEPGSCVCP